MKNKKPHGNLGKKNALKPDSKRGLISVRVATEVRDKADNRAQSLGLTLPQYISKLVLGD